MTIPPGVWPLIMFALALVVFILWSLFSAPDIIDRANREMDEMPRDDGR